MDPKEKAIDLFNKFNTDLQPFSEMGKWDEKLAIKNAIICVDEFLSFQDNLVITEGSLAYQYWQQVRKELVVMLVEVLNTATE